MSSDSNGAKGTIEEIQFQVREMKHSLNGLQQKQSFLEQILLIEFGDGERKGVLGQTIQSLQNAVEKSNEMFYEIRHLLTGDGNRAGLAEQVRQNREVIERWAGHLKIIYGLIGSLIVGIAIRYFSVFGP